MNSLASAKKLQFEPLLENLQIPLRCIFTGFPEIDNLNLNRIVAKSLDAESGFGWEFEEAEAISNMYRVFLFLCKMYPNEILVPPREVDKFWHLHILDTRNYIADCAKIFGGYLHHFPYAGLEGTKLSKVDELILRIKTLKLVKKHFPELIEDDLQAA